MLRRRTILWASLLFVCAAGIVFFRDPDIQWLGPKCKGIREWLARLETPVDIGVARKSMSLQDAISLLYERCKAVQIELPVLVNSLAFKKDGLQSDPLHVQIDLSTMPERLTARQFLKGIIAQIPSQNGTILLRSPMGDVGGYIEITTRKQAEQSKAAYERAYGVTVLDCFWQRFCEAVGGEGHLPEAGITAFP